MKRFLGLDLGSSFIKAALVEGDSLKGHLILPVSGSFREQGKRAVEMMLKEARISREEVTGLGLTGVGVEGVDWDAPRFSEVASHARGVHLLFPQAKSVIDLGGQFTRVIRIGPEGRVYDFLMSEKCATGSGRFLQIMARILRVNIDELGPLSLNASNPVEFSTGCAVFAESEAVSRIAEGANPADIVAGVHKAMASKVEMLVKRVNWEPPVALVGGGGEDKGLIQAIAGKLGTDLLVPPWPRLTAALGAALLCASKSCGPPS